VRIAWGGRRDLPGREEGFAREGGEARLIQFHKDCHASGLGGRRRGGGTCSGGEEEGSWKL
jgi:hypothetical protein